MNLLDFKHIK